MADETDAPKERRKTSTLVTVCIALGVAVGIAIINIADISFGDGAMGAALAGAVAGGGGAGLGGLVGIGIERMMKRNKETA